MMAQIRHLFLLAVLTLLGFGLFVLLFWAGAGSSIRILFYRGVALAVVAAVLTGVTAAWMTRRDRDSSLAVAGAALSLSFNLCFLVLFPVTVDRSVTIFLLSTIERQDDRGVSADDLQRDFIDGYVVRMGAIDRRIDEQVRSGNVTVTPDRKVRLTEQGRRFMAFSRLVARLFGTDPRFVGTGTAPETGKVRITPH